MKTKILATILIATALLSGCSNDTDKAKDVATAGLTKNMGDGFESFTIDSSEIEKDNSVMKRYRFYGTIVYKGATIHNAFAVAQHNKLTDDPEWAFGGCNCVQIEIAYEDGASTATNK